MKLIVALGNPGADYLWTRHNFGFIALDFYFKKRGLIWNKTEKFHSIWAKEGDTIFIKPQTFYNDVGTSVRAFMDFYKIKTSDILVICDDFNIPFGTFRKRSKGSAGGNNGLKSIISCLNTEDFPRFRLGTGDDAKRKQLGDMNFVLSRFGDSEKSTFPDFLTSIASEIDSFVEVA